MAIFNYDRMQILEKGIPYYAWNIGNNDPGNIRSTTAVLNDITYKNPAGVNVIASIDYSAYKLTGEHTKLGIALTRNIVQNPDNIWYTAVSPFNDFTGYMIGQLPVVVNSSFVITETNTVKYSSATSTHKVKAVPTIGWIEYNAQFTANLRRLLVDNFTYTKNHKFINIIYNPVTRTGSNIVQIDNFPISYDSNNNPSVSIDLKTSFSRIYNTGSTSNEYLTKNSYNKVIIPNDKLNSTWAIAPELTDNYFNSNPTVTINDEVVPPQDDYNYSGGSVGTRNQTWEQREEIHTCPLTYTFTKHIYSVSAFRNHDNIIITNTLGVAPQNGYTIVIDNTSVYNNQNSPFNIPVQFRNGIHTYSISANRDSVSQASTCSVKYAQLRSDSTKWFPLNYTVNATICVGSDTFTFTDSKILDTPTITNIEKVNVDSYTVSWNEVVNASSYSVKLNSGGWQNTQTNLSYTFTNMPVGNNTVYIRANYSDDDYSSNEATTQIATTILNTPSNVSINRTGLTTVSLSWRQVDNATSYSVNVNDEVIITNNNFQDVSLTFGMNSIKIYAISDNTNYNSNEYSTTYEIGKLNKPIASGIENYNANNGVEYIKMSWNAVEYAVDYVIRDTVTYTDSQTGDIVTTTNTYDNSGDDGLSLLIYGSNSSGYTGAQITQYGTHVFQVKAKVSGIGDSEFDSDWSDSTDILTFEVHVLKAPTISWKSTITGNIKDQSTLVWVTPIDEDDSNNVPDYYNIHMIPDSGSSLPIYTIANSDNIYKDVSDIATNLTTSQEYTVYVYPYSYNTLYYQTSNTSMSNTLTYNIIKLDTPVITDYDYSERILTWDIVENANIYYIYELNESNASILWGTSDTNTFKFKTSLDSGLHYFFITAGRITLKEGD